MKRQTLLKRSLALVLATGMTFGLVGCGGNSASEVPEAAPAEDSAAKETAAATDDASGGGKYHT